MPDKRCEADGCESLVTLRAFTAPHEALICNEHEGHAFEWLRSDFLLMMPWPGLPTWREMAEELAAALRDPARDSRWDTSDIALDKFEKMAEHWKTGARMTLAPKPKEEVT